MRLELCVRRTSSHILPAGAVVVEVLSPRKNVFIILREMIWEKLLKRIRLKDKARYVNL